MKPGGRDQRRTHHDRARLFATDMEGSLFAIYCPDDPSPELTQDVVVSHQEGLVDLRLSEPALLLRGEEDLDGHPLPPPLAHPHLPVSALADLLDHLDLLGDGSLHLQKQQ